jgi:hypothetical protein
MATESDGSRLEYSKLSGHLPGRKPQQLDLDCIRRRITAGESMRQVAKTLAVSPALLSKRLNKTTNEVPQSSDRVPGSLQKANVG